MTFLVPIKRAIDYNVDSRTLPSGARVAVSKVINLFHRLSSSTKSNLVLKSLPRAGPYFLSSQVRHVASPLPCDPTIERTLVGTTGRDRSPTAVTDASKCCEVHPNVAAYTGEFRGNGAEYAANSQAARDEAALKAIVGLYIGLGASIATMGLNRQ
jgi:hypothetical protein